MKKKMGFFTRLFLGMRRKDEDEDEDEEECKSLINFQNIHNNSSGVLFVWGGITIYKAVKGLFRKFIFIFFQPKPPYPFLPLHNPPPPSLYRIRPFLSPTSTFDDVDGGDLGCGHDVHRENLARRQLLIPLQNPASTSTNTELLLLHPPALVSSPTTILDDDDRRTSSTIIDGEDHDLGCQEEIYWYQSVDNHVVASGTMPAFVEENEIPFPKKEEKKTRKLKMKRQRQRQRQKAIWKKKEDVEEETKEEKKKTNTKKEKKSVIVVVEARWIKHYSSYHRILLVGEGNFSFSACLAKAFRCASNIIATSLDSEAFLKENYKKASSNIEELKSRGSKVMHGIDATTIADHHLLGLLQFDRIVFNFPFAGFFTNLSTERQLRRHRRLVSMFMKNAKEMIGEDGEIHISHKTNGFHAQFELESIASSHGLQLTEAVKFERSDYPGYNTKYGFGGDKNFNCVPSNTFKFGLKTTP